jgi:hypothetical protein
VGASPTALPSVSCPEGIIVALPEQRGFETTRCGLPKRSISRTWKYATVPESASAELETPRRLVRERAQIRAEAFASTMLAEGLTRAGLARSLAFPGRG